MSESIQAKGGRARAAVLSPERRLEIATTASHARWSRPLKPASAIDVERARFGAIALRTALRMFEAAGCEKTSAKIRKAITSADGAVRHAERRQRASTAKELP